MPRMLDLFAGTCSVSRKFRELGWETVSIDWDPKSPADIHVDLLQYDYQTELPGPFDFVWASCPCEQYSRARTKAKQPRTLLLDESLVAKVLEVVAH